MEKATKPGQEPEKDNLSNRTNSRESNFFRGNEMSQQKGAKGGLGRTPPKPAPIKKEIMPWAARKRAGSPGNRGR